MDLQSNSIFRDKLYSDSPVVIRDYLKTTTVFRAKLTSEVPLVGIVAGSSALEAPELVAPLNAAVVLASQEYSWLEVTGAESYEIEFASDEEFENIVIQDTTEDLTYIAEGLTNLLYYWRVRAVAGAEQSDWSTVQSVTILTTPVLTSPSDASFTADTTPDFAWSAIEGATAYDIDIATDTAFNNIVQTSSPSTNSYTATALGNDIYYWRVRAKNGDVVTSYAAYRSLGVLTVPALTSPADASYTADTTPDFAWSAIEGATAYDIDIATDTAFNNIVQTSSPVTNSYTATALGNDIYYWRVRAKNGDVVTSYAAYRSLGVLTVPALTSPADASFTADTTPDFAWSAIEGATAYDIDIASDSAFSNILQTASPTSSTYTATDIAVDGWLYWRVRAKNGAVVTSYAAYRSLELFNHRNCWILDGANDRGTKTGISVWRNQALFELFGSIYLEDTGANQMIFYAYYDTSSRIGLIAQRQSATQYRLRMYINATTAYVESSNIGFGTKYNFASQFNGGLSAANRQKMWINGVDVGTVTGTPPTNIGNGGNFTLYVGATNATALPTKGKIDHLAIRYNRTWLDSTAIGNIHNGGDSRRYQEVATFDSIFEFRASGNIADEGLDNLTIVPDSSPGTPTVGVW